LKKTEILRAGPHFKQTLLQGERIDGKFLRCYYMISEEEVVPLRVGFAVSGSTLNAVRRNRIKRLLRQAVTAEKKVVDNALTTMHKHAWAVFLFKASKSFPVARLKLHTLQPDVAALCCTLASKLQSD
jgi:ribonuclease P protein component